MRFTKLLKVCHINIIAKKKKSKASNLMPEMHCFF